MASLVQNASQPSRASPLPDLEPDDEWKQALKLNIETGLRPMVDEVKQGLNDELPKGVITQEQRERLTADHLATLKTIRLLAEEQYLIALGRERQERRWASGEQLDRALSESMMVEQRAILDRIEKERKNKPPSLQSDPSPPPPPPPPKPDSPESSTPTPVSFNRRTERVTRASTQAAERELAASSDEIPAFCSTRRARAGSITSTGSWKPSSIIDTEKSFLEQSKSDAMPRSTRTNRPGPTGNECIRRKPGMSARAIVQEFWRPSITPEEDAQMLRTYTLARQSSTASATSSFKATSILNTTLSGPLPNNNNENGRKGLDKCIERKEA